jgi:hypothetical protein
MKPRTLVLGIVAAAVLAGVVLLRRPIPTPVTFHHDLAPVLRSHCEPCHHSGGSGPFSLTEYADARKRSAQLADVTARRVMPPWLPEPGCAEFLGDRSLTAEQIALFRRWADAGAPEGDPSGGLPPATWTTGWQLGEPDLVVTLPEPFTVPAEGRDLYRNFVLPLPVASRKFVRAVELLPGNPKVVHHAFLYIDATDESRRLDLRDPEPGFPGLHVPSSAQAPPGHFLSWQPGKRSPPPPKDLAWTLEKDCSLVLQVHVSPTGKPELLKPSVGFFFTPDAPARTPVKFGLWSYEIDLPAGERAAVVQDSFTLPIDVDLLRILPHAHFLGRRLEGTARLPDGTTRCLLRIPEWDFNWQGDYAYREPVPLPRGTVVTMTFTYDNSAENPRNPHRPPRRVRYGLQSSDEMAELWFQAVPRRPEERAVLDREIRQKVLRAGVSYNQYLLGLDPEDAKAHAELGKAWLFLGRPEDARRHLSTAIRIRPEEDQPHYFLGILARTQNRLEEAEAEFRTAARINPRNPKTHGNLGLVLLDLGRPNAAAASFEAALRLDPTDDIARDGLAEAMRARKKQ